MIFTQYVKVINTRVKEKNHFSKYVAPLRRSEPRHVVSGVADQINGRPLSSSPSSLSMISLKAAKQNKGFHRRRLLRR